MSKKTILLTLTVLVSTGIMVYYAFLSSSEKPTLTYTQKPALTPIPNKFEKTSLLYFDPLILNVTNTASRTAEVNIMLDSGKESVSGAQVEMSFDPKALSNVTVLPPSGGESFFGDGNNYLVLFNETDNQSGRISYALAIKPETDEKKGIGVIGKVSFKISFPLQNTRISILEKSMVSKKGTQESLLKEVSPLIITSASQEATLLQQ